MSKSKSIQLKGKGYNDLLYPITKPELVQFSDGKNLIEKLDNISNTGKLENTSYQTANGVKEFECIDGYVDNVFIEGKTLVNLGSMYSKHFDTALNDAIRTRFNKNPALGSEFYNRISNGTFTLYNYTDKAISFPLLTKQGTWGKGYYIEPESHLVITLDGNSSIPGVDFWIKDGWQQSDINSINSSMFMVLEGEHEFIRYFEGLKSVGQGDKIEVLTRKYGSALHEVTSLTINNTLGNDKWVNVDGTIANTSTDMTFDISIEEDGLYCVKKIVSSNLVNVQLLNQDFTEWIDINSEEKYLFKGVYGLRYKCGLGTVRIDSLKIYRVLDRDKKQVRTTLRSLLSGVKDTIEKRGDRYYKVQRCREVILNGSENDFMVVITGEYIYAKIGMANDFKLSRDNMFCDKMLIKNSTDFTSGEFIVGEAFPEIGRYVYMNILKSKLATQDVAGFKNWLKNNPITVVYELEEPIITELPNFNPRTFDGNTTLLLNTGAIQGDCKFEVTNNLRSEIDVIKDKISILDNIIQLGMLMNNRCNEINQ